MALLDGELCVKRRRMIEVGLTGKEWEGEKSEIDWVGMGVEGENYAGQMVGLRGQYLE